MPRPPATIVIPVWNAWDLTHACLDSLGPTVRPRDQVVIVDNGSRDATPGGLRRYPWAEVITNAENRGFAPACNQGAEAARNPALVFLNNDTVVPARWLDALLDPLQDDTVVGCGPRSNFVSGPQMVEPAPYPPGSMSEMRRFARTWREEHRGRTTEVDRLVGFCLAVRTAAFRNIGGFDEGYEVGGYEDDDLCLRLRADGGRLVIAHESFVHHHGHATFDANGVSWSEQELANRDRFVAKFAAPGRAAAPVDRPLVSACLIVKDEEDNLPACLASLEGLVDEVVVYDTGSRDSTPDLARRHGAQVVEGYWDDDFSRARNAALDHCSGRWVLWIDADETLQGDVVALRRRLVGPGQPEGYVVLIENEIGSGWNSRSVHPSCRLFVRDAGRWSGVLHEQVMGPDGRLLRLAHQPEVRILHSGYTDSVISKRGKTERNLALARREVARLEAEGPAAGNQRLLAGALTNLGRALFVAGAYEESLRTSIHAVDLAADPTTRRVALRMVVDDLLVLERAEEAMEWVGRLRRESRRPVTADILEARALLALGRDADALTLLDRVGPQESDDDNFEYKEGALAPLRAHALAALGRHGEAADVLLAALASGSSDVHVGTILQLLLQTGRGPGDLVVAVPRALERPVLAQVMQLPGDLADLTLEAWSQLRPADLAPLAAGAKVAEQLSLERALHWSARLRQRGLESACPLLAVARDAARSPAERVRAAAVAHGTFRDPQARVAMDAAFAEVDRAHTASVRAEVSLLCPFLGDDELVRAS